MAKLSTSSTLLASPIPSDLDPAPAPPANQLSRSSSSDSTVIGFSITAKYSGTCASNGDGSGI